MAGVAVPALASAVIKLDGPRCVVPTLIAEAKLSQKVFPVPAMLLNRSGTRPGKDTIAQKVPFADPAINCTWILFPSEPVYFAVKLMSELDTKPPRRVAAETVAFEFGDELAAIAKVLPVVPRTLKVATIVVPVAT